MFTKALQDVQQECAAFRLPSTTVLRTRTLRLEALAIPLPRRRPWTVARETVSLDHLSAGRLVFGVGAGGGYFNFEAPGEISNPKSWQSFSTRG